MSYTKDKDNAESNIAKIERSRLLRNVTYASVFVAIFLVCLKFVAWSITDSVSILSSLVDSVFDSLASIFNLLAVRHALIPADKDHRFGHGKAEALSGLAQSTFIFGSIIFLIIEVIRRFFSPKIIDNSSVGIIIIVISLLVTIVLVVYQREIIRRTNSKAIKADSLHYLSDLLLNGGVIMSLILTSYAGIVLIDPIVALLISIYVLYISYGIFISSIDELMDREFTEKDRQKIIKIVLNHRFVENIHDLRTRKSGFKSFIQFHLDLPANISLLKAHKISDEVEEVLLYNFPESEIIIHQDPAGIDEQKDCFEV
ncbi:MAG: Ferrous-iron efflux pump FieF [Alphaproteobacteria bacterium MarineAlpha2_Bin1]|nr:MAG: Ferrous-iron efflux pump FieF [Alphaproteobacteria bacterium MarineAlpha2_Bin1]|tara:strand:+ start:611 stop:1552 length:942 start_codon:yes stop_codon:yes gene_type:complete